MTANATARNARVSTPHTLVLAYRDPMVRLKFWTAQGIDLGSQAARAEEEGRTDEAARLWDLALEASPADDTTRNYLTEHAKGAS